VALKSSIILEYSSYFGRTEACETRKAPKLAIRTARSGSFTEESAGWLPPNIGLALAGTLALIVFNMA
jgi:hypothetical protein